MYSPLRKRCRRLLKLNWTVNTCVKIVRVIELINYRSLMCLHQVHGADHNGPESRQQSNQSSTRNSSSPFNLFAVSICFDYPRQWLFFSLVNLAISVSTQARCSGGWSITNARKNTAGNTAGVDTPKQPCVQGVPCNKRPT